MLYDNVKALCEEKGITIWKLERDLKFPHSSVRKWNENEPGIRKVQKVADYLQVPSRNYLKSPIWPHGNRIPQKVSDKKDKTGGER